MNIPKTIFLDVDGCLNSHLYYSSGRANADLRTHIDPVSVGILNTLIQTTDAKVVVSSVWRLSRTIEELQSILVAAGFKGEVIGKTEDLRFGKHGDCILRGNEILAWMNDHRDIIGCSYSDYKHYVIFDDDSDMLYWQRFNFLQVDPYVGLTPTLVWRAEKILNA